MSQHDPAKQEREHRHRRFAAFMEMVCGALLRSKGLKCSHHEVTIPVLPTGLKFTAVDTNGHRHELTGQLHDAAAAMYDWSLQANESCPGAPSPDSPLAVAEPRAWMFEAACQIDQEVGLGHFDYAVGRTARIINEHLLAAQCRHLEQTDDQLRAWWNSLSPEQKADHLNLAGVPRDLFLEFAKRRPTSS